jgi:hypothetical protein
VLLSSSVEDEDVIHNTTTKELVKGLNTSSINLMKFVGAFVVVADRVRRVLESSTNDALDHQILVVVSSPKRTLPCHHPWSLGRGPMQYGIIPTRTFSRS